MVSPSETISTSQSPVLPPSELLPSIGPATSFGRYAVVYEGNSKERMRAGESIAVLIPGVPSTERDFRHLAPYMAQWVPVVRVIFSGFGILHADKKAPASPKDRAHYLSEIATLEGWTNCFIVGHSMGGIASIYWAHVDSRVKALTLICSVGVQRHKGMSMSPKQARLSLLLYRLPLLRWSMTKIFQTMMAQLGFRGHPFHPQQIALIVKHVVEINFAEIRHTASALIEGSIPINVIWTKDDPIIDSDASLALIDALGGSARCHLLSLPSGGHNPQRTCTLEIDRWLRSRYSEARPLLTHSPQTEEKQ